jgi:SAM-dependent methyltransferase
MKRILKGFRERGVRHAWRILVSRVQDRYRERRLGIKATGLIAIETLIEQWTDCHDYFPSSFSSIETTLTYIEFCPEKDVFLDYGCGKGRVLIAAAGYRFRRIIGVEIAPELIACARENIRRCRHAFSCTNLEIEAANAAGGDAALWTPKEWDSGQIIKELK